MISLLTRGKLVFMFYSSCSIYCGPDTMQSNMAYLTSIWRYWTFEKPLFRGKMRSDGDTIELSNIHILNLEIVSFHLIYKSAVAQNKSWARKMVTYPMDYFQRGPFSRTRTPGCLFRCPFPGWLPCCGVFFTFLIFVLLCVIVALIFIFLL